VHRDIKPANIFLCKYGEEHDFVKVLDFGLVTAFGGSTSDADTETALTRAHAVQGTPAYMAPEQALGRSDVDGRVDVYATGCVAYWLITGQQPFEADTPMGVLMHHAHTPAVPPSRRTDLPIAAGLEALILACLAKDPDERPASARDLSRRLGDLGLATWTEDRARDWWRAHLPDAVHG
jgi:serine/threonine-protein kinase